MIRRVVPGIVLTSAHRHVRLPGDLYLPSPLGRFRVRGVGRQAGGHSPPARTSRELWFASCPLPGAETGSAPELRAAHVDLAP
jgi:hypothetical protein